MEEYLYKVGKGKVWREKIIKETNCYYWIVPVRDWDNPFHWKTRCDKTECTTAEEAIKEEINSAKTQVGMFSDRLDKATDRLNIAEELLKNLDS